MKNCKKIFFGPFTLYSLRVPGPMALGPWARVQRANRPKGPIGPWPRANRPKEPPGIPRGDPTGIPRDPPWDPKGPPKITISKKNRFFKKISVMLHQWVFYRTYPYDNTIFDNDFARFFYGIALRPLMYRSGAIFMKIDYFSRKTYSL